MRLALMSVAVGCLAAVAQPARAEYFEYSTNSISITGQNTGVVAGSGTSVVTLTLPGASGPVITLTGNDSGVGPSHNDASDIGTDISFASITVTNVSSTTPLYDPVSFDFSFTITLTDYTTPTGGSITGTNTILVSGKLSGSIGDGNKVNLGNLMSYATSPADGKVTVGPDVYTVTLPDNSFNKPGSGTSNAGRFSAHVQAVPEPSSLALIGLGSTVLAGGLYRRRKATAV